MTYRELAKKLGAFGCYESKRKGRGSHRKWVNPASGRVTVIPDEGRKNLKDGTIKAILRQLGIDSDEWREE